MIEHIKFEEDSLSPFHSIIINKREVKPIYIICQNSLFNAPNFDINKLINKEIILNNQNFSELKKIKLNFTSDEILSLQLNKKEFYIVDKPFLLNIGFQEKIINNTNILFFEDYTSQKFLFFQNENKILLIHPQNQLKKYIGDINNDIRKNILICLILLYANEKELNKYILSVIDDEYDLKKYYLVNKKWVDQFKLIFNYKYIFDIFEQKNQKNNSYKKFEKNLEYIISNNNEFKNFFPSFIDVPKSLRNEINFLPEINYYSNNIIKNEKELSKIEIPFNFELIPKSLYILLKQLIDNKINDYQLKHKILLGNSTLYIQSNNKPNIFYIYLYDKNNSIYCLYAIFNFFNEIEFYSEIDSNLKEKTFIDYIIEKNYDIHKINIPQDISDGYSNKILGELILVSQFGDDYIKEKKIKNKLDIYYSVYKNFNKFYEQLGTLKHQNIDLSDINNIDIYLSQNKNEYIPVYLIESDKLDYYKKYFNFEYFEQYEKADSQDKKDQILKYLCDKTDPYNNLNIEIVTTNELNLNNRYSFVYENFCKDMKLPTENYKPYEALLFVNQKQILLYYKNFKLLLKIDNFNNNVFNIIKFEYSNNSGNTILNNLILLYKYEKEFNNLIIENKSYEPIECYIINKIWLNEYKKLYNYNVISQKINKEGDKFNKNELLSLINKSQLSDYFKLEKNIIPNYDNVHYKDSTYLSYPIDFEIIKKDIFELIIKELDKTNQINLGENLKIHYAIFCNNRIFINYNEYFIFICTKNNKNEYENNYIIYSNNKDILNKILSHIIVPYKCEAEYYLMDLGLDLKKIKTIQNINSTDNNTIIIFISISPLLHKINNPRHCKGLENIGATCYMNATLQCLCHINNIKKYFNDEKKKIKNINNINTPLLNAFIEVITNLWKLSNEKYYAPNNFKNLISELNPLFRGIQANDSKDLIIFIYETLHKELNNPNSDDIKLTNVNNSNIPNELKEFRNNYYSQNKSIIVKIFYSEQSNNLKCCSCNFNKVSYNIISFLIFPLEKIRLLLTKKKPNGFANVSLEDCFEMNEESEILNGQNQIFCNNCHRCSDALSYNKLYNCPEVLTIILNRGKGLEFDVEFKFPMFINIEKYVIDKSCETNYELIGVLTHLGPSGMSGHFIAYCKSPVDNNWYCYNDSQVSKCIDAESEINSRGIPYVLFYQIIKKEKEKEKQNPNSNDKTIFILYFGYNEKEVYLEINENNLFKNILIQLFNKYSWIPKEGVGFYTFKNNNYQELDIEKTVSENGLKNGDKISIF